MSRIVGVLQADALSKTIRDRLILSSCLLLEESKKLGY